VAKNGRKEVEGATTQSLFREVNERIEGIGERQAVADGEVLCECAKTDCTDVIPMTREEYETVRRLPTHFLVAPGHVVREIERVVEENERYMVVEKFGEAGMRAVQLDPRRRRCETADPRY
jgi:hypothetical protein